MTPPTHTYAIFDEDGKIEGDVFLGYKSPDDCVFQYTCGKKIAEFYAAGYTCRAVTVCDRARLDKLVETAKEFVLSGSPAEKQALIDALDYWMNNKITERSEGEHD